ncbi:MAG: hypothetical protein JXR94_11545 [Candidatus Hydrogenedentes bacterium]|nr:hypothetical protein [Candidatus Hydrogenedentota bacterium]
MRNTIAAAAFVAGFFLLNALIQHVQLAAGIDQYSQFDPKLYEDRYRRLVLGDSHAVCGILPDVLGDTANYSGLGDGYMVSYYKLEGVLDTEPQQLETVILQVDRHSFALHRVNQYGYGLWARSIDFADLSRYNGPQWGYFCQYLRFHVFTYADLPDHLAYIVGGVGAKERNDALTNWMRNFAEAPLKDALVEQRIEDHILPEERWWEDEMVDYFRRILELCRARGLRVVAVRFPVSKPYSDALDPHVPPEEFDAALHGLLADYPEVTVLDYSRLFADRDDYFVDPNHLNVVGSRAFTVRLRDDLAAIEAGTRP